MDPIGPKSEPRFRTGPRIEVWNQTCGPKLGFGHGSGSGHDPRDLDSDLNLDLELDPIPDVDSDPDSDPDPDAVHLMSESMQIRSSTSWIQTRPE